MHRALDSFLTYLPCAGEFAVASSAWELDMHRTLSLVADLFSHLISPIFHSSPVRLMPDPSTVLQMT